MKRVSDNPFVRWNSAYRMLVAIFLVGTAFITYRHFRSDALTLSEEAMLNVLWMLPPLISGYLGPLKFTNFESPLIRDAVLCVNFACIAFITSCFVTYAFMYILIIIISTGGIYCRGDTPFCMAAQLLATKWRFSAPLTAMISLIHLAIVPIVVGFYAYQNMHLVKIKSFGLIAFTIFYVLISACVSYVYFGESNNIFSLEKYLYILLTSSGLFILVFFSSLIGLILNRIFASDAERVLNASFWRFSSTKVDRDDAVQLALGSIMGFDPKKHRVTVRIEERRQ